MKPIDKLTEYDQHRLLISTAEEIEIDWPGFFDWKPITMVKGVSLAISLVAALVGSTILCWEAVGYILNAIFFLALK